MSVRGREQQRSAIHNNYAVGMVWHALSESKSSSWKILHCVTVDDHLQGWQRLPRIQVVVVSCACSGCHGDKAGDVYHGWATFSLRPAAHLGPARAGTRAQEVICHVKVCCNYTYTWLPTSAAPQQQWHASVSIIIHG